MKKVLHVGAVQAETSNRLALQLGYTTDVWATEVLHIRADAPGWPAPRDRDSLVARKLKSLIRLISDRITIASRLFSSDADIMHAHENASLWALAFWVVVLRRPAVWDPHDYFHDGLRKRSAFGRRNIKEYFEKLVIRRGVSVIVVSEGMRARYHEMYPRARIEVLNSYSSTRTIASNARIPRETGGVIRLVYPGLIKPARLECALLQAIGELENVTLDVYGVDPTRDYQEYLENYLDEKRIINVRFRGSYSSFGIGEILARYDFALFPYPVLEPNIDFCLPNKFYQCIDAGLPIVTTDMEEIGQLVRRHGMGYVFPSRNYGVLAAFLKSFDIESSKYAAMARAVGNFHRTEVQYETQGELLLDMYEGAAGGRG